MATQVIQVIRAGDLGPNLGVTPGNKVAARTIAKQCNVNGNVSMIDTENQIMPSEMWGSATYRARVRFALRKLQLADVQVLKNGGAGGWNRFTIKAGSVVASLTEFLPSDAYNFEAMDGFDGGLPINTELGFTHVIEPLRVGAQFNNPMTNFPYLQFRTYSETGIPMLPSSNKYPVKVIYISNSLGVAAPDPDLLTYSLTPAGIYFYLNESASAELTLPQDVHIDQPAGGGGGMVTFADWDNPTQAELDAMQSTISQGLLNGLLIESGTGVDGDPFIITRDMLAELIIAYVNDIIPDLPQA